MFEKREYRMYKGVKREAIYQQVCDFWARSGFYVSQISPFHIQGQSYYQKIGLKREFFLRMDEHEDVTYIDLSVQAKITDEGLIGGVAATVLLWPVAVVGGALSYDQYENDAKALMGSFWGYVDSISKTTGVFTQPHGAPIPPHQAVPTMYCQGCGAIVPQTWKACPYCGRNFG
jgi:hypothetical protein